MLCQAIINQSINQSIPARDSPDFFHVEKVARAGENGQAAAVVVRELRGGVVCLELELLHRGGPQPLVVGWAAVLQVPGLGTLHGCRTVRPPDGVQLLRARASDHVAVVAHVGDHEHQRVRAVDDARVGKQQEVLRGGDPAARQRRRLLRLMFAPLFYVDFRGSDMSFHVLVKMKKVLV